MEWMIGLLFLLELVIPVPLKDSQERQRGFPIATMSLVTLNVVIFIVVLWMLGQAFVQPDELLHTLGIVPNSVLDRDGTGALSLVTGGFLHTDWLHLLGNMVILGFFGRKVEDVIGPFHFLLFYLVCLLGAGIGSTVGRYALSPLEAEVPSIGASGAVSGVMAAYLFLFAGERIVTLVIPIPYLFRLAAWIYILYNVGHDLLLGLLTEEFVRERGFSPFGTDVFAHLGGLIAGLIFIYLYLPPGALVDRRLGR